ncbi:unnamed protein product, partial [Prorocentrum cordatum]
RPQPLCFEAAPARAGARHGRASPGATARGARSPAGGPARGGHGAEQPQAVVGDAGRRRGPRRARTGRGRRRGRGVPAAAAGDVRGVVPGRLRGGPAGDAQVAGGLLPRGGEPG